MKTVKFISKVVMVLMVLCISLSSCNKYLLDEEEETHIDMSGQTWISPNGYFMMEFIESEMCIFYYPGLYMPGKDLYSYVKVGDKLMFRPISGSISDVNPLYGTFEDGFLTIYNKKYNTFLCTLDRNSENN